MNKKKKDVAGKLYVIKQGIEPPRERGFFLNLIRGMKPGDLFDFPAADMYSLRQACYNEHRESTRIKYRTRKVSGSNPPIYTCWKIDMRVKPKRANAKQKGVV